MPTKMRDEDLEREILEKNLTAPRVSLQGIKDKIRSIDIVTHLTSKGSRLRWAVLEMANGFTITGKPSASVSPENDDVGIGEKVAFDNAMSEAWALEGYLLTEELHKQHNEPVPPAPAPINEFHIVEKSFNMQKKMSTAHEGFYINCKICLNSRENVCIPHSLFIKYEQVGEGISLEHAIKLHKRRIRLDQFSILVELNEKFQGVGGL